MSTSCASDNFVVRVSLANVPAILGSLSNDSRYVGQLHVLLATSLLACIYKSTTWCTEIRCISIFARSGIVDLCLSNVTEIQTQSVTQLTRLGDKKQLRWVPKFNWKLKRFTITIVP